MINNWHTSVSDEWSNSISWAISLSFSNHYVFFFHLQNQIYLASSIRVSWWGWQAINQMDFRRDSIIFARSFIFGIFIWKNNTHSCCQIWDIRSCNLRVLFFTNWKWYELVFMGCKLLHKWFHLILGKQICLPVFEEGLGIQRLKESVNFCIKLWVCFCLKNCLWADFMWNKYYH